MSRLGLDSNSNFRLDTLNRSGRTTLWPQMGGNGEELMETYLVTGANRGIGLAYCQQLQARGDSVIAVCRQISPELESLGVQLEAASS